VISGFETFVSQTIGNGDYRQAGILRWEGRIIICITFVPLMLVPIFTEQICLFLGQDPTVAKFAQAYMYISLPEMLINGLYTLEKRFLNAFMKNHLCLIVQSVGTILYPLWCYIFIVHLDLGAEGSALANLTAISIVYVFTLAIGYSQKDMAATLIFPTREVIRPSSIIAQLKLGSW
jgi:MATE family multidrug resistance protein